LCSHLLGHFSMSTFERGQIVEHDGLLAVVVGTPADGSAPEDHVALWYGEPRCTRISQGGTGGQRAEVFTVPAEVCVPAASPIVRH
jgi:hypothetical protein